ncbi:MAG: bacterial Ig-like domain-containing protein [Treponema sp.]|jgi:hypothetical protein|nr:bacterial Ig-like domain-containing protein [Treponema sp.]
MVKKAQRFMGLGSVLVGALLCAGCFNLLEPPVQPRSKAVTVTFTLDGEGGMARSVLPRMSQFTRIELSAQAQGKSETLGPVAVENGRAELTLGGGAWDVSARAYTAANPAAPAAAATNTITNTGGMIDGETRLNLLPVGTGAGILRYAVTLPEGISLAAEGSRIQVELQGEAADSRTITKSAASGEFSLEPGIYAADIALTDGAGKTAAYREAVSILSGLATEIAFSPAAGEFLDPGARALLTAPVLFKTTAGNSSQVALTNGGSDVRRTLDIAAPREKDTLYFAVAKNASQTLTVSGTDAGRVSKPGTATDGTTPSTTLTVFAVDTADLADSGGVVSFAVTAGETGKTPIETAVTIAMPQILSLAAAFNRFEENNNYSRRITYKVGDTFDYDTLTVGSYNSDGSNLRETVYDLEGFDTTTPGTKTIRVSKNGMYAQFYDFLTNGLLRPSIEIYVVETTNARLVFDYGSWETSAVPALGPPGGYTTPLGRSLVLAPVKWNIPENAVYTWTVSGGSHSSVSSTTEYYTFMPTAQGEYSVTVSTTLAGGQKLSATTKVTCCPPEGTYKNTAKRWGSYIGGAAPTQFNHPLDGRAGGSGFGGGAGGRYFTESVPNSGSYDLRIVGNAFGGWIEPGIIWVAQDVNGNGEADDTWYELKGAGAADGVEIIRRYAVTFHANGSWQDNLGKSGYVPGGPLWYPSKPQSYPNGIVPDWITLTNTCIINYADASKVWGYADTLYTLFKISDAIQADGTPVHLDYIDFVVVRTGMHRYTDLFGEISTEVMSLDRYNPYDPERKLTGVSNGSGGYTYKLVNNSGYEMKVSVAVLNGVFTDHILSPGANQTITLNEAAAYFDYSGGNVVPAINGNTLTFGQGAGGD